MQHLARILHFTFYTLHSLLLAFVLREILFQQVVLRFGAGNAAAIRSTLSASPIAVFNFAS
jgi:hypothetical protein